MPGVSLSEIYQEARRSLLRARDGLERLERLDFESSSTSSGSANHEIAVQVKHELTQLETYSADLDRLWRSQVARPNRDLWKRKVEQIVEEVDLLKTGLDKYLNRQRRRQTEAQERAELFRRTNGDSSEGARILQIFDEEAQAMQAAQNSSRMLDEAYATGVAVLTKYAEQRDRLKRAQRKALDILNTVGLSNSVLRLIERRHRMDKRISYVGMVLTFLIVIMVWRWTH